VGTPTTYTECFEWFLAPTDANDQNPDPALSPDIITNSWTCPPSEGCLDDTILRLVVANVRAAGIAVVVAAGNGGPVCGTIVDPPALYPESFTVGSTRQDELIAVNSSRGPALLGGESLRKPDVSAPGVLIRSARKNSSYRTLSGTSMATPHVAGLMALMISANPALAGNVDALESIIRQTAVPLTTTNGCGGDTSTDVPNHTFGDGRIDALAAVQAAATAIPGLGASWALGLALCLALSGSRRAGRGTRG
jgi:subtilisin family serine protease